MGEVSVPVVDLRAADVAARWEHAMSSAGFAVVVGHGLEPETRRAMFQASRDFFLKRSAAEKEGFVFGAYGRPYGGFTAQGVEAVSRTFDANNAPADLVESYVLTPLTFSSPDGHAPELLEAGRRYFDRISEIMHTVHALSARALGLPKDFFDRFYADEPSLALRLAHYPAVDPGSIQPSQQRYGAHVDYEAFTFLAVEEPGQTGLEVWLNDRWNPVSCPANSIIVNVGALLSYWSGGRWKATVHRVVNHRPQVDRFSLPFFTGPNLDTVVVPINAAPGSAGISAREHQQRLLSSSDTGGEAPGAAKSAAVSAAPARL